VPKVFSYIRFSSPEQAKGDSLRRQTEKAAAWSERRGLALDTSLRDLGISAFRGANRDTGALRSFLQLVEKGEIEKGSILIVESLDRISREAVLDAAARLFDLIREGITVVTLSDGQEYSAERLRDDWTPLIVSIAIMARAHEESKIKGQRVGEAWAKKKNAARAEKRPLTSRCPEWLRIENGRFVPRAERVDIVQRIFAETIAGHGRRTIVKGLNRDNVPTFRGKLGWQESSVAKVVTSRMVLGEYQPHSGTHKARNRKPDGEPIKDYYPPIVDEETYWRAQRALQGRLVGGGRKGASGSHILQGIAKCAECGSSMHIINKGPSPKGGIYYLCSSSRRATGCENGKLYRVDHAEASLLKILTTFFPKLLNLDAGEAKPKSALVPLLVKLEDRQQARDRLQRLAEAVDFDDSTLSRYKELISEIREIKKNIGKVEAEERKKTSSPDIKSRLAQIELLNSKLKQSDQNERTAFRTRLNEALRNIITRITFSKELGAIMEMPRLALLDINKTGGYVILNTPDSTRAMLDDDPSHTMVETFVGRKLKHHHHNFGLYYSKLHTNDLKDQAAFEAAQAAKRKA
jgi:DNA invertase Pin-like site-specific DNA recombinase